MIRSVIARFATAVLSFTLTGSAIAGAAQAAEIPATATTPALSAYVARPAATTPTPALLMLHGCEGFSDTYTRFADALAHAGYTVVAIDSVTPSGKKTACGDPSGASTEAADALAALAWMRTQPSIDATRLALVGYSMGSIAALDIVDARAVPAAPPGVRGAVLFYPACSGRDPASVRVPLRIFDGDADDWIPPAPCNLLAGDATADGAQVTITTYPGATHAFNVDKRDRTFLGHFFRYDAAATRDADARTLEFLHAIFAGAP